MAESACLRRSFSNPTETSHGFSQGDPLRALGESISFGRYMSESLAWEKFSTFSNNRYLEEAEKYSKPGSVAKMKAHFEAHYKKIAARKQATQEEAHDGSGSLEARVEGTPDPELLSSEPVLSPEVPPVIDSCSTVSEPPREVTPEEEIPLSRPVSQSGYSTQPPNEAASSVELGLVAEDTDRRDSPLKVQLHQFQDAEANVSIAESSADDQVKDTVEIDIVVNTSEREVSVKKEAEKDKCDLTSEQIIADLPDKRSKKNNVSKLSSSLLRLSTPVCPKREGNATPRKGNVSKISSSIARLVTPVRPKNNDHGTLHRMLVKDTVEKRKPPMNSVHMSMDTNPVKKPLPASYKTRAGKSFTPLGKASVNSVSRQPSATPQSETRRSRVALEKSFARISTSDRQLKSPSVGNVKPARQTSISFSPFSFRTEERAVKRRELFQKRLEKEAENLQLTDKPKIKPAPESWKLHFKNPKANSASETATEVLRDNLKIPPSRSQPPKSESKAAPDLAQDKFSRLPHRRAGSKPAFENSNKNSTSVLVTKKRHENTPPNIPRG